MRALIARKQRNQCSTVQRRVSERKKQNIIVNSYSTETLVKHSPNLFNSEMYHSGYSSQNNQF